MESGGGRRREEEIEKKRNRRFFFVVFVKTETLKFRISIVFILGFRAGPSTSCRFSKFYDENFELKYLGGIEGKKRKFKFKNYEKFRKFKKNDRKIGKAKN